MKNLRHSLAAAAVLTVSPLLLAAPAFASPGVTSPSTALTAVVPALTPQEIADARAAILDATNAARADAGLAPLTEDPDLDAVAQACSDTQAGDDTMAHCTDAFDAYPAGWTSAAENVASGQTVEEVVAAWLASPGHRANILDPAATHLGIGFAVSADGSTYFTQNFAAYPPGTRPVTPPPADEPAPAEPAPEEPATPAEPGSPAAPAAPAAPADPAVAPAPAEPAPAPAPAAPAPAPAPAPPAPAPAPAAPSFERQSSNAHRDSGGGRRDSGGDRRGDSGRHDGREDGHGTGWGGQGYGDRNGWGGSGGGHDEGESGHGKGR